MKKQLSYILITLLVLSLSALPVEAAKKRVKVKTKRGAPKKQLILAPGQHCFQLAWVSLYCYQL